MHLIESSKVIGGGYEKRLVDSWMVQIMSDCRDQRAHYLKWCQVFPNLQNINRTHI